MPHRWRYWLQRLPYCIPTPAEQQQDKGSLVSLPVFIHQPPWKLRQQSSSLAGTTTTTRRETCVTHPVAAWSRISEQSFVTFYVSFMRWMDGTWLLDLLNWTKTFVQTADGGCQFQGAGSHLSHQGRGWGGCNYCSTKVPYVNASAIIILPLWLLYCLCDYCHLHPNPVSKSTAVVLGPPQWGAADAEIKVPSGENTELKRSPFIAWSRSVYSHTCYAYCQGVLPCLFLPFQSIHLHFFKILSQFFPVLACRIK